MKTKNNSVNEESSLFPLAKSRPVKRRKLHEEVADRLLNDIRSGCYPVGGYLPSESDLMNEFGVGRPAIRESLAKLARLGLLELKAGVRPKVCKLDVAPMMSELNGVAKMVLEDPAGQQHMQEIRMMLEATIARFAARTITPKQLRVIWALLEEFRKNIEGVREFSQPMIVKLSDLDFRFHRSIVEVVGNPIIVLLQQSLFDWLVDQRKFTLGHVNQPETTYHAHLKIYNCLAARDPEQAEKEMISHIEQVNATYRRNEQ